MRNFLIGFITVAIALLWIIPVVAAYVLNQNGWGVLYIPIFIVTIAWGITINDKWDNL